MESRRTRDLYAFAPFTERFTRRLQPQSCTRPGRVADNSIVARHHPRQCRRPPSCTFSRIQSWPIERRATNPDRAPAAAASSRAKVIRRPAAMGSRRTRDLYAFAPLTERFTREMHPPPSASSRSSGTINRRTAITSKKYGPSTHTLTHTSTVKKFPSLPRGSTLAGFFLFLFNHALSTGRFVKIPVDHTPRWRTNHRYSLSSCLRSAAAATTFHLFPIGRASKNHQHAILLAEPERFSK